LFYRIQNFDGDGVMVLVIEV